MLKGFDEVFIAGIILIDLQKAFDTINMKSCYKSLKQLDSQG